MKRNRRLSSAAALSLTALFVLTGCAPAEPRGTAATIGQHVYQSRCSICHGRDGRGNTPTAASYPNANLVDGRWAHGGSREEVIRTIRQGVPKTPMLPFGQALSDSEIEAVADYVLALPQR
jgi:mono/diheme cytochrome c family protein